MARGMEELAAGLERDPRAVATAAAELAAEAAAHGDLARRAGALTLLGRAHRLLGDIDLAASTLTAAIEAADAAADDALRADAHLAMAAVLSFAGRSAEAVEHVATAEALGTETIRAHALLQRAAIAQRVGDVAQALDAYARALPVLEVQGSDLDVARVLANRGVIRIGTGEAALAGDDLRESAVRFEALGNEMAAAQVRHNLGWAMARLGDLPAALAAFDDAQTVFDRLGYPADQALVERAEVLLGAGLSSDALTSARAAADRLEAAGNRSTAAEALLLTAQAARLEGQPGVARTEARRARERFEAQGAPGWAAAARVEELLAAAEADGDESLEPEGIVEIAELLAEAGNVGASIAARALAVRVLLARADVGRALDLSNDVVDASGRLGQLAVRLDASAVRAEALAAAGEPGAAIAVVRGGFADLVAHQATLGATDARGHLAEHASRLGTIGLRLAMARDEAAAAFEWVERGRVGLSLLPPVRPDRDPAVADAMARLRTATARLRDAQHASLPEGIDAAGLEAEVRELEAVVRSANLRVAARHPVADPPPLAEVCEALGERTLVEIAVAGTELVAVVATSSGGRLVRLGPARPVIDAAVSAAGLVARLARPDARAMDRRRLERDLGVIGDLLVRPLRIDRRALVLVVPGPLVTVPWSVVPGIAGRPVTVAPSAAWWHREIVAGDRQMRERSVLAVAGPRLTEADAEVAEVVGVHGGGQALVGSAAGVEQVRNGLEEAGIAHLATHGHFRHDHPLWSHLELADGPLTIYDVEQLATTPELVVLSACESGVTGTRAGDELLGLAHALLRQGTRSLVAAIGPLPDTPATREAMVGFHRRVVGGATPSEALVRDPSDLGDGTIPAVAFVACFGVG